MVQVNDATAVDSDELRFADLLKRDAERIRYSDPRMMSEVGITS